MYLNPLFLIVQILAIVVENVLAQGLTIDGYPIPEQCTSACTATATLFNTCSDVSCLCTTASDSAIQECINCAFPLDPDLASGLGTTVGEYNVLCSALPPLTVPPTAIIPTSSSATPLSSAGASPFSGPAGLSETTTTTTTTTSSAVSALSVTTVSSTTAPSITAPSTTAPPSTSPVVSSTATTTVVTLPVSSSTVTTTSSASVVSASTKSGAELSFQSQLGNTGIAIGISFLLRLL